MANLDRWLREELQEALESPPAARPRYREAGNRRSSMDRIRLSLVGAVAAAVVGGGVVAASAAGSLDTFGVANHGAAVSSAARTCPRAASSDRDIHGDCVSSVARMNHGQLVSASRGRTNAPGSDEDGGLGGAGGGTTHGDVVSNIAQNGPMGTASDPDAHGDAVSSAARSNHHR